VRRMKVSGKRKLTHGYWCGKRGVLIRRRKREESFVWERRKGEGKRGGKCRKKSGNVYLPPTGKKKDLRACDGGKLPVEKRKRAVGGSMGRHTHGGGGGDYSPTKKKVF